MESLQDEVKRLRIENEYLKTKLKESTWEELYYKVCSVSDNKVSFKEYKESQPRTFTEMFDTDTQSLKEGNSYEEIYSKYIENEKLQETKEDEEKLSENQLQEDDDNEKLSESQLQEEQLEESDDEDNED